MNNSLEQIRERLSRAEHIIIGGHLNPDGDAIGSCCALGISLKRAGKKVTILLEEFAEKYHVIPAWEEVQHTVTDAGDLFVALDCGDKERLGFSMEVFDRLDSINIDHHISNTYFGKWNYVMGDLSSTSEIVYHLLAGYFPMDQEVAAALYTGILYDTGGFRHTSTSPVTMSIAAELMTYQIPFSNIYYHLFDRRSLSEMKLLGLALSRAELAFDGKIVVSYITGEDLALYGATSKELDSIVGMLKGVKDVHAAVFLYEKAPNEIKASFRSEEQMNVCELAEEFGGGGHKKASGCTLRLPMKQAMEAVFAAIAKRL